MKTAAIMYATTQKVSTYDTELLIKEGQQRPQTKIFLRFSHSTMIASLNINWAYLCTRDLMKCAGDPNQISEYKSFTLHIFNYSSIYFVTVPETDPLLSKWRKRKVQHHQIDPSHPLTQLRCTTLWTSATARAPHSSSRGEYPHQY